MYLKTSQNSNFLRTPFYIEHLWKISIEDTKIAKVGCSDNAVVGLEQEFVHFVDVVLVTLKKVSSGLLFVLHGLVSSVLYTVITFLPGTEFCFMRFCKKFLSWASR